MICNGLSELSTGLWINSVENPVDNDVDNLKPVDNCGGKFELSTTQKLSTTLSTGVIHNFHRQKHIENQRFFGVIHNSTAYTIIANYYIYIYSLEKKKKK
jgi:hypothetical protein